MQVFQTPSSFKLAHLNNSQHQSPRKDQILRQYEQFRQEVSRDLSLLVSKYNQQIKDMAETISRQQRVIRAYQERFGPLSQNLAGSDQSPNSRLMISSNRDDRGAGFMGITGKLTEWKSGNKTANFDQEELRSPRQRRDQNRAGSSKNNKGHQGRMNVYQPHDELGFQEDLFQACPPDEVYKSRFEVLNRNKKQVNRKLYETMVQDKECLNKGTEKLLSLIGTNKSKQQEKEVEIALPVPRQTIRKKSITKQENKQVQALNSSMDFLNSSIDKSVNSRSSRSRRKKASSQISKPAHNAGEENSKTDKHRKVANLLSRMRNKIQKAKPKVLLEEQARLDKNPQSPTKKSQQGRLLPTGGSSPGKSKVLINPTVIDLQKRRDDADVGRSSAIFRSNISEINGSPSVISGWTTSLVGN